MENQISHRIDFVLNNIAFDLTTNKIPDLPPQNENGPLFFFVMVNSQGEISKISSSAYLDFNELLLLTQETLKAPAGKGNIVVNQVEYSYLKSPIHENQDTLIIFQNYERERSALNFLITALSIVGLVCLILSFFGSLFMASHAMIPIQKAWQQQKDFLADASHELRTPLAVIQTNLEIVQSEQPENKWLRNIQEATTNMSKLVDSLLFLSRADAKEQIIEQNCFYLNEVVHAAIEPFKPLAELNGLLVKIETETNIPFVGDETKIKQLIGILVDNAVKHTGHNGIITIKIQAANNSAFLTVSDTGEGISSEHLEKIFDRFYQADRSRSKGGAGLGLAIAKWIAESHHGKIKVTSSIGQGTTVTVSLPTENLNRQ